MSILFMIFVLAGFLLWFLASLPGTRVPEYWARLSFLAAAVLWALPMVSSAG